MSAQSDRLTALCRSMNQLVAETPRMERIDTGREDVPGCAFRFTSAAGAMATLVMDGEGVVVTTYSGDDHPEAGEAVTRDVLGIDLDEGFGWDDVICSSADELAGLLRKHMFRRTKEATPEPGADTDRT